MDVEAERAAVDSVLSDFHRLASEAAFDAYFALFAPEAVFFGTDATERWGVDEFRSFAEPTSGWTCQRQGRSRGSLNPDVEQVIAAMCERYPAFGYRKIGALLRREGHVWNPKRVYRYMRRLNRLQPRRRAASPATPRLPVSCPVARNTRWEMDLKCEVLADGRWGFQLSFTRFIDFYHNERPIGTAGYRTPRELGEPDRIATTPVPEVTLIPCPA